MLLSVSIDIKATMLVGKVGSKYAPEGLCFGTWMLLESKSSCSISVKKTLSNEHFERSSAIPVLNVCSNAAS